MVAAGVVGTDIRGPYQAYAGRAGRDTGRRPKAVDLARPRFNFEKRQKELARKKKQEKKRPAERARKNADSTDPSAAEPHDASESP